MVCWLLDDCVIIDFYHTLARQLLLRPKQLMSTFSLHSAGKMQKKYLHSVPIHWETCAVPPKEFKARGLGIDASKTENYDVEEQFGHLRRMVIVFRRGRYKLVSKDSGVAVTTYCPRLGPQYQYTFGRMDYLKEGSTYTRENLLKSEAHM
jgi:hypothetical protein